MFGSKKRTRRARTLVIGVLMIGVVGCSHNQSTSPGDGYSAGGWNIEAEWNKRDVDEIVAKLGPFSHVSLVPVEETGTALNHPIILKTQWLEQILGSVAFENANGNAGLLFDSNAKPALAEALSEALSRARPRQEVIFEIAQEVGSLLFFKSKGLTTGRVFVKGDQLHVIVGAITQSFESQIRANGIMPLIPLATRARQVSPGARIMSDSPGVTRQRGDWLAFNLRPLSPMDEPQQTAGKVAPTPVSEAGSTSEPESRDTKAPDGRLSEKAGVTAAGEAEPITGSRTDKIAEKLRGLRTLRADELITAEEYQQMRENVLNQYMEEGAE